jgi:hypothetical protein
MLLAFPLCRASTSFVGADGRVVCSFVYGAVMKVWGHVYAKKKRVSSATESVPTSSSHLGFGLQPQLMTRNLLITLGVNLKLKTRLMSIYHPKVREVCLGTNMRLVPGTIWCSRHRCRRPSYPRRNPGPRTYHARYFSDRLYCWALMIKGAVVPAHPLQIKFVPKDPEV